MPDKKGKLYLFEAIELRNEYDRHLKLLEKLIKGDPDKSNRLFHNRDEEEKEPAVDFDQKELGKELKKIQTKRVKLNQAIQMANFKFRIDFNGEKICLAEALEIRKNLLRDSEELSEKVMNSAYKRIIHKEERDIVHEPKFLFKQVYKDFQDNIGKIREIVNRIHIINHKSVINFREE